MTMVRYLVALSLFVLSVYAGSDVFDWTDKTFDDAVKEHDIVLIEFFAPW